VPIEQVGQGGGVVEPRTRSLGQPGEERVEERHRGEHPMVRRGVACDLGGEAPPHVMDCPDPDTLGSLISDALPHSERAAIANHAAACPSCHELISALLGSGSSSGADGTVATLPSETADPSQLLPGAQIDRYVIESRLGAGGMGVVYVARDPDLGRRVALKVLRAGAPDHRLLREAQSLARLSHPNVVAVHDVGAHDGQTFIAMALVEGANLRKWLATERPVVEILRHLAAAGRGLAAAHAAGLIHRDLKPDNIFISDGGQALVGDFGLAAERGEVTGGGVPAGLIAPDLTVTGMVLGTPAYMPPEQALGDATAASDQFSFCVTAWEALYRSRPFAGASAEAVMAAAAHGRITPPARDRGVPAKVRRALARGLSADPAARFPSMDALLFAMTPKPRKWPWAVAGGVMLGGVTLMFALTLDDPAPARVAAVDATVSTESVALTARLAEAQAAIDRFDADAAERAARTALTLADRLRDDLGRAHAGALLVEALIRLDRGVEAAGQLAQAEVALERGGGAWEVAIALEHARAVQAGATGDRVAEVNALRAILDEQRERRGDGPEVLRAGVDLANALQRDGRVPEADEVFASVAHLFGDDQLVAVARVKFESEQAQTAGDMQRAIDTARQLVALTRAARLPVPEQAEASWGLGASCELVGDWACARDSYRTATELLRVMPGSSPGDLVGGLEGVARQEIELGHPADAIVWVREALERARTLEDADLIQTASLVLARALLLTGQHAEARTLLEPVLRELDADDEEPNAIRRAAAAFGLAQALWETGGEAERARARVLADDAIRDFQASHDQYEGNPAFVTIRRILLAKREAAIAWRERHP